MIIKIENIADYVDQTITIQGWIYAKTGKGKLHFVQLRDGTGICLLYTSPSPRDRG